MTEMTKLPGAYWPADRSSPILDLTVGGLLREAVTDAADEEAPQRFDANLPIAKANLASLLRLWLE